jgi:hypothetical protein
MYIDYSIQKNLFKSITLKYGTRDRARTCDLRLRRALLFQLSYSCLIAFAVSLFFYIKKINIKILAATYSHTSTRCTTISTSWLNFCVRNGNRCTSTVITTKSLISISSLCLFLLLLHNLNS